MEKKTRRQAVKVGKGCKKLQKCGGQDIRLKTGGLLLV